MQVSVYVLVALDMSDVIRCNNYYYTVIFLNMTLFIVAKSRHTFFFIIDQPTNQTLLSCSEQYIYWDSKLTQLIN